MDRRIGFHIHKGSLVGILEYIVAKDPLPTPSGKDENREKIFVLGT